MVTSRNRRMIASALVDRRPRVPPRGEIDSPVIPTVPPVSQEPGAKPPGAEPDSPISQEQFPPWALPEHLDQPLEPDLQEGEIIHQRVRAVHLPNLFQQP